MPESWDENLRQPESEPPLFSSASRSRSWWPIIALIALLVVAGAAVWYGFLRSPSQSSSAVAEQTTAPPPPRALGAAADTIELPPLQETDPIVRKLVSELSSHPRIAAWLATDGLVRNFTTSVVNVADGSSPAPRLQVLKPSAPFEVEEVGEDLNIDPASYRRYDALADAVASIDAAGAARLYTTLKPRIEDAHRELGFPDTSFDRPLERAIVSLLAVPQRTGPLRVEPKGIGYRYEDEELESLTAAQKQLLRMGPRNVRIIQDKLRAIALELGIPAERLPKG